jgi:hypothetical protein
MILDVTAAKKKEAGVNGPYRIAASVVAVCAMSVFTSAQQPSGGADQAVRTEINAFMDQYWELFSAGRIDQLVERIYHPSGQLSNQGHSSIEDLRSRFPDSRKTMLAGGYGKSQMPTRNICVLSPTVAIVSGRGFRYLTDGRVMGEFGWTYTLLKGAAGWRMVAIYSHDPGKALTCSS